MHTYPDSSVTATLLDNSSEGSSPQSSVSNEEEVQELFQHGVATPSVSDTKPIYNFSIPDMIRHRSTQDAAASDSSARRTPLIQPEIIYQRRSSGRRLRQAFPVPDEEPPVECRPRKCRRLSGRNVDNSAAFIDLTDSPEVYSSSARTDLPFCSRPSDLSAAGNLTSQSSNRDSNPTWVYRGSSRQADCDSGAAGQSQRDVLSHSPPPPGRHARTYNGQHRVDASTANSNTERRPPSHGQQNTRAQNPPVINLEDSPLGFEFGVTPRMMANARQFRLHRRDIFSDFRAELRSQLEHARQARQDDASQVMQQLDDIALQGLGSQAAGSPAASASANAIPQDEVQFIGEWRPRQARHEQSGAGLSTSSYHSARRARRLSAEARGGNRMSFLQSLFPHLHSRRVHASDYLLPYMRLNVAGAPPLHHLAGQVDASTVEGDYEALWRLAERLGPAKPKGLSKAEIEKIPAFRFSSSCMASTNMTCVICMSEYSTCEKLRRLSCSHDFHSKCIDKWLKCNKTCPVCRDEVKT